VTEVGSLKWIEVVLLLAGGALFFGWQWRDLRRAREESARKREAEARPEAGSEPPP
jgi:hypothetical protein